MTQTSEGVGASLKLYLLVVPGWYKSSFCVVVACSEEEARYIDPTRTWGEEASKWVGEDVSRIHVEELGTANSNQKAGTVICASFIDIEGG